MYKHRRRTARNRTKRIRSYTPSVNNALVSLRTSQSRKSLVKCNNYNAFLLKEPLKISLDGTCYTYDTPEAQAFLLSNLKANKQNKQNKYKKTRKGIKGFKGDNFVKKGFTKKAKKG